MVKFPAKKVVAALEVGARASVKVSEKISVIFNQFVDACRVSDIPKDSKGANQVASAVRESFVDLVAFGSIEQKTVTEYAQGAKRAFFHNVPWTPILKNDPAMIVPSAKTGKTRANAGSVKTTDNAAIVKTLTKALEQARIMQSDSLAAGIVDLIIEIDPEFKESAE